MRHLTRSLEIELECMDMSKDVVFLEELDNQRLIKVALGLYCVIFALIALDIISDYGDGIEWSHLIAEVVVLLIAVIGIGLFWRQYYQSTQLTLRALQTNLTAAHEEVQRWRNESHEFIAGLGVEIQKQFKRWELSNAEAEVGLLLLKGFSHQEIANIRNSSERTVREQARAVYRKSNTTGRSALSAFFLEDLLLPST
jgi:DNA-binding CsgD family transcriptional regulator